MDEKKPYSDSRWHDIPVAKSIGRSEMTEEEEKEATKKLHEAMIQFGFATEEDFKEDK